MNTKNNNSANTDNSRSSEVALYEDPTGGIEPEQEDIDEKITEPFDPEQIRIRTVPFLVQQLVSRIDHDDIDLQPDFQRLQGIWFYA